VTRNLFFYSEIWRKKLGRPEQPKTEQVKPAAMHGQNGGGDRPNPEVSNPAKCHTAEAAILVTTRPDSNECESSTSSIPAVFSSADLVAAELLLRTVVYCSILFFSVKNCLKIN
jgi:hypothetical protein